MSIVKFHSDDAPPNIVLLQGLKPDEVDLILASARRRRFSPQSIMTCQGEPADYLFLLWKGQARYFYETPGDKKLILKWITPGDIFGGAALVSGPSNYLVSAEAVRSSVALEWNAASPFATRVRF
jgi:CRP/FNR family transcriptional regulator, nitrogen oxide reductase regulator